jgi:hypothetical protein
MNEEVAEKIRSEFAKARDLGSTKVEPAKIETSKLMKADWMTKQEARTAGYSEADARAFQIRSQLLCQSGLNSPAARQPKLMHLHKSFVLVPATETWEQLVKQALGENDDE